LPAFTAAVGSGTGRARVAGADGPWFPSLDEFVEEKAISKKHREGAEIRVWSAVPGFAYLVHSGPLADLGDKARADALEELLHSVIAGPRGRSCGAGGDDDLGRNIHELQVGAGDRS
jgi:hypothetical protein